MRDTVIYLISYSENDMWDEAPREEKREVYANWGGISQSEFYRAAQAGLKPQIKMTVFEYDYSGEKEVEFDGRRYEVIRVYPANGERMELYLTEKAGCI